MAEGLQSAHEHADDSPGLLLWQVTSRWQATLRAALKPFDLTHPQFVLLASLTWLNAKGPVTQRHLADHVAMDPMTTSQVLRTLESRGLVERAAHPTDGRARALAATDRGADLARRANAVVEARDAAFFTALGPGASSFAHSLRCLRDAAASEL
ncbi:MAG: MarR family transcriptional regulator [Nocardioides sp.]|jgi:DNA-binding MarR family transcriptional regulator|uniref:MarR family winged helix-turn-helix transcriptional regulator n=1 Tax=Nocardioides sp. TaxID=35761 RepID=UPI00262B2B0F|nr:MarR family transcriptional regulator [Nocardioides sp.]MCW2832492.1 MarR family transcriptional regulator [Nocardioides sp.]